MFQKQKNRICTIDTIPFKTGTKLPRQGVFRKKQLRLIWLPTVYGNGRSIYEKELCVNNFLTQTKTPFQNGFILYMAQMPRFSIPESLYHIQQYDF